MEQAPLSSGEKNWTATYIEYFVFGLFRKGNVEILSIFELCIINNENLFTWILL